MKVFVVAVLLMFLLAGCGSSRKVVVYDKINIAESLQVESCRVFADHYECNLTDGRTFYAMKSDVDDIIASRTTWDCSAWKEGGC